MSEFERLRAIMNVNERKWTKMNENEWKWMKMIVKFIFWMIGKIILYHSVLFNSIQWHEYSSDN